MTPALQALVLIHTYLRDFAKEDSRSSWYSNRGRVTSARHSFGNELVACLQIFWW